VASCFPRKLCSSDGSWVCGVRQGAVAAPLGRLCFGSRAAAVVLLPRPKALVPVHQRVLNVVPLVRVTDPPTAHPLPLVLGG